MKRKSFFCCCILGLLLTFAAAAAERNILLIVTDDESPTLKSYGDPLAVTPELDRLAQDGFQFNRAYATAASCSASRSVILSGVFNHRNGQYGHVHSYHKFESFKNLKSLTLPTVLDKGGYRTAQVGKFHVAPEETYRFQHYFEVDERHPVAMANAVEDFLAEDSEKPFFLYYATGDPHRSHDVDETYNGELKPNLFGNLPGNETRYGIQKVEIDAEAILVPPFLPDTAETRSELEQYYQSCARVDQGLGRLLEILKANGLYDKTLIVFTSDHGIAFAGAKTNVYEAALWVPLIVRNPYVGHRGESSDSFVSHEDITPTLLDFAGLLNQDGKRPVNWCPEEVDSSLPELIRDNRGEGVSDHYHGKSWLALLENPDASIRKYAFASHTFHEIQMYYPMRAIWDDHYKLIWNIAHRLEFPSATDLWTSSTWQSAYRQGPDAAYGNTTVDRYLNRPEFELFDVSEGRYETENLSEDPAYADVLQFYKELLKEKQLETQDPWVLKWQYE